MRQTWRKQIQEKAREIDACKTEMLEFQSSFVPPRKFNFSQKRIDSLKTKAAEYLVKKFELIHPQPGQATQQPRQHSQRKDLSRWVLPNLFGEQIVTNRVLPLGFSSVRTGHQIPKDKLIGLYTRSRIMLHNLVQLWSLNRS